MSTEISETIPIALRNIMNVREISRDEKRGCLSISLELNPDLLTVHGEVHGGYISMITMVIAELIATTLLREAEALVVVNHDVNFLRHVEVFDEIEVEGCVLSKGERIMYIETHVRYRDEDIAQAITSFIVEKV